MLPAFENNLSEGTEFATTVKYFRAILVKIGKGLFSQNSIGDCLRSIIGCWRYKLFSQLTSSSLY